MRVVAIVQAYNEQRFIAPCIEHLRDHGVDVYLVDNESTDDTVEIAQRYLGNGVIDIETLPRAKGAFSLKDQLERKEELAAEIDADWLIHNDCDEFRASPKRRQSIADALAEADAAGYNAVNFLEFTFVPTREEPDHDHDKFQRTMRRYYPFLPLFPHQMNAWKRQDGPIQLAGSGGHQVHFPGLSMYPRSMYMRHYLFLSGAQAVQKFAGKTYAKDELDMGWHGWRSRFREDMILLPSNNELRKYRGDHKLDPTFPRTQHIIRG